MVRANIDSARVRDDRQADAYDVIARRAAGNLVVAIVMRIVLCDPHSCLFRYMLFSKPGDADTSIFLSDPGESVSSFDDWNAGII